MWTSSIGCTRIYWMVHTDSGVCETCARGISVRPQTKDYIIEIWWNSFGTSISHVTFEIVPTKYYIPGLSGYMSSLDEIETKQFHKSKLYPIAIVTKTNGRYVIEIMCSEFLGNKSLDNFINTDINYTNRLFVSHFSIIFFCSAVIVNHWFVVVACLLDSDSTHFSQ